MKPIRLAGAAVAAFAFAACSAPQITTQAPVPVRQPTAPVAEPTTVAKAPYNEPPTDWQLYDLGANHLAGISLIRADTELLSGLQPRQTVLVAVIDGGLDTADVDLRPHLWQNPGEIPGNGKDDDHNGYIDDTWGWNFIGGPDGRDINNETLEITRVYTRCNHMTPQLSVAGPAPSAAECARINTEFPAKRDSASQLLDRIVNASNALDRATRILSAAMPESLTVASVEAYQPAGAMQSQAKAIYLQLEENHITKQVIADALKDQESQVKYGYNPTWNPRPGIVGDNLMDLAQRDYGNRDVTGPDALHGSHVSGIIGAIPDAREGIRGIAQSVRIMMIRTVPNGDERDKDVANAIRYAVDNGARVINMSFGKEYSPQKADVDAAVKYADAHGVLMVHAAGNDNHDNDTGYNFPTPYYLDGGKAQDWIEVGATSWKGGDSLVASFSNYGQQRVDVFAPGVDIKSTVAHNEFRRESGTSMAAPVVTGLAALIMSYYPQFTAAQVKHIILASSLKYPKQMVVRPGAGDGDPLVPFGTLSVTGGIVNAYTALQMAAREAAGHTP